LVLAAFWLTYRSIQSCVFAKALPKAKKIPAAIHYLFSVNALKPPPIELLLAKLV
jgi:hypothetical protein